MFIFFFVNWVNIKYFNLRQTLRIDLLRNRGNTSVYMYLTAQICEDDRRWMPSQTWGATYGLWFICETASVHCICIYISFASKYIRSENKSMTIKWPTCIVWNAQNSNCALKKLRHGSAVGTGNIQAALSSDGDWSIFLRKRRCKQPHPALKLQFQPVGVVWA